MRALRTLLVACAICAGQVSAGDAGPRLDIRAGAASVAVDPQQPGRRLLRLPALEFPLRISPSCPPDLAVDSVSISIADTRQTYSGADFASGAALETLLRLPRNQIGPLAVDSFCIAVDGSVPTARRHLVAAAFSAQASLRCRQDDREEMRYAAISLDVELRCGAEDGPPGAAGD